ncbi:MAG: hypothetical protein RLY86_2587 [Pseudomonadota bacterium]|jgi:hypothetical protein
MIYRNATWSSPTPIMVLLTIKILEKADLNSANEFPLKRSVIYRINGVQLYTIITLGAKVATTLRSIIG